MGSACRVGSRADTHVVVHVVLSKITTPSSPREPTESTLVVIVCIVSVIRQFVALRTKLTACAMAALVEMPSEHMVYEPRKRAGIANNIPRAVATKTPTPPRTSGKELWLGNVSSTTVWFLTSIVCTTH